MYSVGSKYKSHSCSHMFHAAIQMLHLNLFRKTVLYTFTPCNGEKFYSYITMGLRGDDKANSEKLQIRYDTISDLSKPFNFVCNILNRTISTLEHR